MPSTMSPRAARVLMVLALAVRDQPRLRMRLVSLLISRAELDPDEGAHALSQHLGFPAALQRHLEGRDRSTDLLIPPELGARWVVAPLNRARSGALVVVARDPTPLLAAALTHAAKIPIIVAVTPAIQVERLVRSLYGIEGPAEEPLPSAAPTVSDIGDLDLSAATPPPLLRSHTISMFGKPDLAPRRGEADLPRVDDALRELAVALSSPAAERAVLAYLERRWRSGVLARIESGVAIGQRGHGPRASAIDAFRLSLAQASSLQHAYFGREATMLAPATESQRKLAALLGDPVAIAAAPVIADARVLALLAVGDVISGSGREALVELDRLAAALGEAYRRLAKA